MTTTTDTIYPRLRDFSSTVFGQHAAGAKNDVYKII